jgi:hypothetical protein
MDEMINLLGHVAGNANNIDACVVAVIMKPTEDIPEPSVEVMTIGDNAIRLFGISEFIRHELYKQLEKK